VGGSVAVSTKAWLGGVPAAAKGCAEPGTAGKWAAGGAVRAEGALAAEGKAATGAASPGGAPDAGERPPRRVCRPQGRGRRPPR
jgi:hypothetical protein